MDHSHIMNFRTTRMLAVQGLLDSKIRATFCYTLYSNPGWEGSCIDKRGDEDVPDWRMQDAQRIRRTFLHNDERGDLVRFGVGPSETEVTPADQIAKEIQVARNFGAELITYHVGFGQHSPGSHNIRELLGPDLVFSHATTFQGDELDALKIHELQCLQRRTQSRKWAWGILFASKLRTGVSMLPWVLTSAPTVQQMCSNRCGLFYSLNGIAKTKRIP